MSLEILPQHVPASPSRPKPLANTSPWYDKFADEWAFVRETLEGGEGYLERHIFRHPKELAPFYAQRLRRAVFPNHARAIVDTYKALVYKQSPARAFEGRSADMLNAVANNIDLAGHGADEFFQKVFDIAYSQGHAHVLCTRYDGDPDASTEAAQREAGTRPFARVVPPEDLVDWSLDFASKFRWAMVRETDCTPREFDEVLDNEHQYVYRLWTRDEWVLYRVEERGEDGDGDADAGGIDYVEIDRGTHALGEVPIYTVYIGKRDDSNQPVSESPLKDIVPMIRRIANLISLADEQIYQYIFSILIVPEEVWDSIQANSFGVGGSLPRPKGSEPYEYIAPDVEQIEVLQEQIRETEQCIRRLSGVAIVNEQSRAASSGLALAYRSVDKRALVMRAAGAMEALEIKVFTALSAWMGIEPQLEDITVEYKVEIDPGEVEQALSEAITYASLRPSGEAAIENMIQATKARFGRFMKPEELSTLLDEVRESMRSGGSEVDAYRLTNVFRSGLLSPTADVVRAAHAVVGMPEPTPAEANEQVDLAKQRQEFEAGGDQNEGEG